MKKFIYKINQYLLENHPIIWNTKLVWFLSSTLILHILFFIFGFLTIANPTILHEYGAKSIFFDNGSIFISIILSILILVIWLIFLFKNNAFKSFYPTSRIKLFKQFLIYLIITFFSTTFYISYNYGVKSYISYKYDDNFEKEISISNTAALFFSKEIEDYTINQRKYPHPFNTLYCETFQVIPDTADNDSLLDRKYRFYTLSKKEGALNQVDIDSTYLGYIFHKTKGTTRTYFYKDSVFDASNFIQTTNPSYLNYSKIFYLSKKERSKYDNIQYGLNEYDEYEYYNYQQNFTKNNELWNKRGYELLKRNNLDEIKQILANFLSIAHKYEIKHNLNVNEWFDLIYHPNNNFELKHLIRNAPKKTIQFNSISDKNATNTFYQNHITDYYLDFDALYYAFDNIEEIKASNPLLKSIHFFIWFSFFFSAIIFMFRITGLKPLLFTIINVGILTVFIALLTVFYEYTNEYNNSTGYFVSYLTLILGTIFLSIPLFYSKKLKKLIVAICLNISITGFILYIFLIITIISLHQSDACVRNYNNESCFHLMDSLGVNWSYVLFIINLLFIYFYSGVIKNWKALPEG